MDGAAITADDLGLRGPKGTVFEGVNVSAEPGSLVAITGPSGTGRTCLLLTLTGRMRPTSGSAEVGGHRLPRHMAAVRRIASLGPVTGVTDLEAAWTVREQLRERALLRRYRQGWRPEGATRRRARVAEALERAGLELDALPHGPATPVRELERMEAVRLGIALALLDRPRLLAVDDVGLKLSDTERAQVWALLRSLTEEGTTVLAVSTEPPEDAVVINPAGATARAGAGAGAEEEAGTGAGAAPGAESGGADTAGSEPVSAGRPGPGNPPEADSEGESTTAVAAEAGAGPDTAPGAEAEAGPEAKTAPSPEPQADTDTDPAAGTGTDPNTEADTHTDRATVEGGSEDAFPATGRP
ncbi:ATP-binding cassette domain-containing protein [Streptomyces sp. JJ66]|uniref:ATP-binding cassette domain-containing protein n=1 Tax=Streptomyces sp. JJ66 TaxID=2803843 RepID=UPI001C587D71|nr:ATP-binding cassette domain-containing protein [Streptomyces sp. JJ66]MBW1604651.1 ATP-binding cassette domain-containing protein [Streptomyces sp. JJ66]